MPVGDFEVAPRGIAGVGIDIPTAVFVVASELDADVAVFPEPFGEGLIFAHAAADIPDARGQGERPVAVESVDDGKVEGKDRIDFPVLIRRPVEADDRINPVDLHPRQGVKAGMEAPLVTYFIAAPEH